MNINETFKLAGVHNTRDKILVLCNAPKLFFDCEDTEDNVLVHKILPIVGELFTDYVAPNNFKIKFHLKCILFDSSIDLEVRRNLVYGMRDKYYLDTLVSWAISLTKYAQETISKAHDAVEAHIQQETGTTFKQTLDQYRLYHRTKNGEVT